MHSLLPIGKGVARIAFASAAKRQTYVVPTGIEHGSFFRYRYPCTVTFGDPIDVNAFLKDHEASTEAETFQAFRNEIGRRSSSLITYIPDDENYEAAWQAVKPVRKPQKALAVLTAPLFLLAALLCLPLWVTAEVLCYFKEFAKRAAKAGVTDWILDPGFGFAKTVEQNWTLLEELELLQVLQMPILVGVSRKSMIYKRFGITPEASLPATQVAHYMALERGATWLRVHDVAEAQRTVAIWRGELSF
jgi:hypothetical protein